MMYAKINDYFYKKYHTMKYHSYLPILCAGILAASCTQSRHMLPELPPMPEIPESQAVNSVPLGNINEFAEVQLDIPITEGPFQANWPSIEANYPGSPEWLREAKFGIWVHFGPQSAGESGDWYARHLYKRYSGTCSRYSLLR